MKNNQFFPSQSINLFTRKWLFGLLLLPIVFSCSDDGQQPEDLKEEEEEEEPIEVNLFLEENFDYGNDAGDITALSTWERYGGSIEPIQYSPDGLNFDGYPSTSGGAITIVNGSGSREDVMRSFDGQSSGVLYSAQLINISSVTAGNYFYSLADNGEGFFARIFAMDDGNGGYLFGTALNLAGGGSEEYTTNSYNYNTTYLVVVKYDFATTTSSLFVISGDIPTTEPAVAEASANSGDLPTTLNGVKYRQNNEVLEATVDGIRISDTWEGALGIVE